MSKKTPDQDDFNDQTIIMDRADLDQPTPLPDSNEIKSVDELPTEDYTVPFARRPDLASPPIALPNENIISSKESPTLQEPFSQKTYSTSQRIPLKPALPRDRFAAFLIDLIVLIYAYYIKRRFGNFCHCSVFSFFDFLFSICLSIFFRVLQIRMHLITIGLLVALISSQTLAQWGGGGQGQGQGGGMFGGGGDQNGFGGGQGGVSRSVIIAVF